jgi:hypothetical protein
MLLRRERSKRKDTTTPCSCAWRLAAGWVNPVAKGNDGSLPKSASTLVDGDLPGVVVGSGGKIEGFGGVGVTGSPPVKKSSTNCKGARMVRLIQIQGPTTPG